MKAIPISIAIAATNIAPAALLDVFRYDVGNLSIVSRMSR